MRWRVELTGQAPRIRACRTIGVNAIAYAGRLMGELLRMEEELKALAPASRASIRRGRRCR